MFKINRNYLFLFAFILLSFNLSFAQTTDLETIIKKANEQTLVYEERFKDLIAKETKTFETFTENGQLKKSSVVESNFIVYQSQRDNRIVSEYRNVTKVDGKLISGGEKTSEEFLSELQKTSSVEKELEKVQKESLRFDKNLLIQDLTLLQAPVLSDNFRPFFEFGLVGSEMIEGNEVYVISYRQTKKSPFILVNEKGANSKDLSLSFDLDLPGKLKKTNIFLSGKLWIDAKTFQLRREERNLTAQTENPILLVKTEFEYQPGEYDFLVPKHILLIEYKAKKRTAAPVKDTQVSFDYSQFTKTNVEVKLLDDEQ